ncbi:hypothetical protein Q5H91_02785 [Sphingomonas sp. KR1UV-12]|uniref:Uncharacterized protein n=1 Tax=Sphingomonas aurea TaxID=3063994 RepID=A0ABT9EGM5_9SPHN|nr:hypothetical protein [Sphingomonas sp. KR1UV-12]MDP1026125.1 hypothetical protein [Sphingomonas sp. KR1UV-12]
MRIALPLSLILLSLPAMAVAQQNADGSAGGQPPQRVRSVTLTGEQQCPKSEGDEIVVCSRNDEPYRIPKALRNDGPIPVPSQSWVNRVADIDQAGRVAGGLPNTCSPIGTGGQTGCSIMAAKQWAAERRAQKRAEESVP